MPLLKNDAPFRVRSWRGLGLGVIAVAVCVGAWLREGHWTYLLLAVGFACMALAWSQKPLPLSVPLRVQLKEQQSTDAAYNVVTYIGLALIIVSLTLRWLL